MKRALFILMALAMVIVSALPALAAEDNGRITITNAAVGETYSIYRLATLNSFDKATETYSYTVEDAWKEFFTNGAGKNVFDVTAEGNYLIIGQNNSSDTIDTVVNAALAYATENNIDAVKSEKATANTLEFTGLALGYYLVDTTLGTLCSIDTTDTSVEINEKNQVPAVDKTVKEDSGDSYVGENDADLFENIDFRTQISFKLGGTNYMLHDKMSAGLTFVAGSIEVYNGMKSASGIKLTEGTDYTVVAAPADGCTFEIRLANEYCNTLAKDTEIYVYYKAFLNENAVIGTEGNPNETWLSYGDAQTTTHDITTTRTYEFEVVKTDDEGKYLPGATFSLWNALTSGNEFELYKINDTTYRLAKEGEATADIALLDGKAVKICGLDGNTDYFLQEETAPAGYNKMVKRAEVALGSENLNLSEEGKVAEAYENGYGGIRVINKAGNRLPETGGMGTVLFIAIGAALVVITGVLLVAKKRMSKIAD